MSRFRLARGQPLLDIGSLARRGPGHRDRLSPAQIEHISRTVRRVPEVMIKVSGGGLTTGAVAAHLQYIDRHGHLDVETDEGERLHGKPVADQLINQWDLKSAAAETRAPYSGRSGPKPGKLVHNLILSMPKGTPPKGLLAASRAFAREQFALKHRYALVLHTDQDHPHVHLVVKTLSHTGERLNIRKATLREWRQEFARHLREQGIAANATERAVRGLAKTQKSDGFYRAMLRGESTQIEKKMPASPLIATKGRAPIDSGRAKLLDTHQWVQRGWRAARVLLANGGQSDSANQVRRFSENLPEPRTGPEDLAFRRLYRFPSRQHGREAATR